MTRLFRASLLWWMVLAPSLLLSQTYQDTCNHARDLLKQKQYAQALDEVRQAIHLDSSHCEVWYVAGTSAVGLEKYDLAVDYFQEALPRAPEQARGTTNAALEARRQILASRPKAAQVPTTPPQGASAPKVNPAPVLGSAPALEAMVTLIPKRDHFGEDCLGTLSLRDGEIGFAAAQDQSASDAGAKNRTYARCAQYDFHSSISQIRSFGLDPWGINGFYLGDNSTLKRSTFRFKQL